MCTVIELDISSSQYLNTLVSWRWIWIGTKHLNYFIGTDNYSNRKKNNEQMCRWKWMTEMREIHTETMSAYFQWTKGSLTHSNIHESVCGGKFGRRRGRWTVTNAMSLNIHNAMLLCYLFIDFYCFSLNLNNVIKCIII